MKIGSPRLSKHLHTSVVENVQYELSRCFMNYAKDQLINKEYSIMMDSNILIDKLSAKLNSKSFQSAEKQFCNPTSSNTLDTLLTQQDQQVPRLRQRPFARRTGNGPQRVINNDYNMNVALEEIRENCSVKTYSTVNNLIQNYQKAKRGGLNQSKAQLNVSAAGLVRSKPETDRSNYDQAIILTARNLKLQKQNSTLVSRQKQLQQTIEQLWKKLESMKQTPTPHVQKYLKTKQKNLQIKQAKIQKIHQDIIRNLQTNFNETQNGCNRCCTLVKKIKDSLIKYKICLEEDIQNYRSIWMDLLKQERERVLEAKNASGRKENNI